MTVFFSVCCFFYRCNAHAASPHLGNDDTPVRWHQSGGGPHLAKPLSNPPVSRTLDRASARDAPGYRTESARAYAGFHWLSSAPSQTAARAHQRWDTSCNNRGQTAISPPLLAVSLWNHRQVYVFSCRMRPLFHTVVAGLPGTCQ